MFRLLPGIFDIVPLQAASRAGWAATRGGGEWRARPDLQESAAPRFRSLRGSLEARGKLGKGVSG